VATVTIAPGSPSIKQNESVTLTATTKDASGGVLSGRPIAWSVDRADVANLSSTSGQSIVVTGGVSGTAAVTATSENRSTTLTITVTDGSVATISVSAASTTIKQNTSTTVSAIVRDASGRPLQGRLVTWSVPGGDPATISPASSTTTVGANSVATTTVTAKSVSATDTARITATAGGKSGVVTITVTK
jgi:hypothetical protein